MVDMSDIVYFQHWNNFAFAVATSLEWIYMGYRCFLTLIEWLYLVYMMELVRSKTISLLIDLSINIHLITISFFFYFEFRNSLKCNN